MRNRKVLIILVSIFSFLMLVGGTSYAYFIYNKDIGEVSVETGNISLNFSNSNNLSLTNIVPMNDNLGKIVNNYIDFTVNGSVDTERIYYEVYIVPKNTSTMTQNNINNYVKTYLTDQSDVKISNVKLYKNLRDSTKESGKILYQDIVEPNSNGTVKNITKDFRLRLWLDEAYTGSQSEIFNFSIYLYAINVDENFELPLDGAGTVRKAITSKVNAETNACNPIWVDDMGTANDTSDDITYFSGTNDCVDMNYVWYSGKLWRITAIYPDGSMKMITENNIASISWGSTVEYDGSWVYQWLNEDFYDTLVNQSDIIINNATWNYSTSVGVSSVRPESLATQKIVSASTGLLNLYEYYNAYRNTSKSASYLNKGYRWWLLTPSSSSNIIYVNNAHIYVDDSLYSNKPGGKIGIRPSINIKSGLEFTGSGTKDNPYKIVGDKESPASNTLISSRSVGEYVKFDSDIYRIVSVDETLGTTKLTRVDYIRDNGTVITKNFASSAYFGKSTNTQSDTYWDYYLNNKWYNSISSIYKNMLVDGIYYLGLYQRNYKTTICKDTESTLDTITVKNCTKYTSSDADKIFTGKVGLPRVGEMFSAQLGSQSSSSSDIWTITPQSSSYVWMVYSPNNSDYIYPNSSYSYGVRPSITLKAGIKITGGTGYVGGETNSPFEISE